MVCNSGVGLTPVIDGEIHQFSAGGLYDGLSLLVDDETRTYWDHMTGEGLHGPLRAKRLPAWNVETLDFETARRLHPEARLHDARPGIGRRAVMRFLHLGTRWPLFPPGFRATMGTRDPRLPEMELGLGVIDGPARRFYPLRHIRSEAEDTLDGRRLRFAPGPVPGLATATWEDGTRPLQILSRWYGFSATFPGCSVFGDDAHRGQPRK